eukprot:5709144-Pleurochrysis_carterae.AAC.2
MPVSVPRAARYSFPARVDSTLFLSARQLVPSGRVALTPTTPPSARACGHLICRVIARAICRTQLYESDCIFDKFDCEWSHDSKHVCTGAPPPR